jgi:two-component sensor histidine kinase
MRDYISDLVKYLQNSFALGSRIKFEQAIEPLNLNITQAIPLGLIINEGLINAVKYAFPNEQQGTVRISFTQDHERFLLLKLSDNGIGLASHLDIRQHKSLGIELMEGLTKQLNGKFNIESGLGLHITVRFPASDQDFKGAESSI